MPSRLHHLLPLAALLWLPLLALALASTPTCLDNDGNSVRWWFTYKLPSDYQIAYIDANSPSNSGNGGLELFPRALNDEANPVALVRTLQQLATTPSPDAAAAPPYLMYNDEPPNGGTSSIYGHTKGVVGIGEGSTGGGFWLLHSTPKFPDTTGSARFWFPESETTYGQTFLCVTLEGREDIEAVATQFLYTRPNVYANQVPESTAANFPNLTSVLQGNYISDPGSNSVTFGYYNRFTSYAKNAAWDADLYEDLVAPGLGENLIVESWLRGSEEGPYCTDKGYKYQVVDVNNMQAGGVAWKETQDHAKWAVVATATHHGVCIADINRMTTQRNRGGGAICFVSIPLKTALAESVVDCDSC